MQPVGPWWDQTIRSTHRPVITYDVLASGVPVLTGLPLTGGSIVGNRSQFCRRTLNLTLPPSQTNLVGPYLNLANELRVWRGVILPDGSLERKCVGTFLIYDIGDEDPVGGITITGYDRAKWLMDDAFPYPRTFAGFQVSDLVRQLITESVPWAGLDVVGVPDPVISSVTYANGRDAAVGDLAKAVGGELVADPFGQFILRPLPATDSAAVWVAGPGAVATASRAQSRTDVYNGVYVTGNGAGVQSDWVHDDNPNSPTFWGGPFGHKTYVFTSQAVVARDQAQAAAVALLGDSIGGAYSVSFSSVVNPALEPGDVVNVPDRDGRPFVHLLESLTIPLTPGGLMSAESRSAQVPAS